MHTGFGHVSAGELDLNKAMRNLTILVERGVHCGVCVSLENLSSHWTRDPELFAELIAHSGAGVTLDIGHVHASHSPDGVGSAFERYLLPHKNKIMNAHIYHTELEGLGHVAPGNLEDIYDRLEQLRKVESCGWWVIKLKYAKDILHTKDLLTHYINASYASPLSDRAELKIPRACVIWVIGFLLSEYRN